MSDREWFEILNRTVQNIWPPRLDNDASTTKIYFKDLIGLSPQFKKHGLVFRTYGFSHGSLEAHIDGKVYPFTLEELEKPVTTPTEGPTNKCWTLKIPSEKTKHLLKDSFIVIKGECFHASGLENFYDRLVRNPELWHVNYWVYDQREIETGASFLLPSESDDWEARSFAKAIKNSNQLVPFFPGIQNFNDQGRFSEYKLFEYFGVSPSNRVLGFCAGVGYQTFTKPELVKFYYGNADFNQDTSDLKPAPLDCYEGVFVSGETHYLVDPDKLRKTIEIKNNDGSITKDYVFECKDLTFMLFPIHFNEGLGIKIEDHDGTSFAGFYNPTSQQVFIEHNAPRPREMKPNQSWDWATQTLVTCENNNSFAKINNGAPEIIQVNGQSLGVMATSLVTTIEFLGGNPEGEVPIWDLLKAKHHLDIWKEAKGFVCFHYTAGEDVKKLAEVQGKPLQLGYMSNAVNSKIAPGKTGSITRTDMVGNAQRQPSFRWHGGPGTEMIGIGAIIQTPYTQFIDLHRIILVGPPIAGYSKPFNY